MLRCVFMSFKDYLRDKVKKRQSDLARKINVSQPTLTRWMNGESIPDMASCLRIAVALHEDPAKIFEMVGRGDWAEIYRAALLFANVGWHTPPDNKYILG